jgi:hypothetical protein
MGTKENYNTNKKTNQDKMQEMLTPVVPIHGIQNTRYGQWTLKEIIGDLFSCSGSDSLCHCISKDYKLGKGIAKIFRDKFGRIDELKRSGSDIGGIAILKDNERYIYNLITKNKYSDKLTY